MSIIVAVRKGGRIAVAADTMHFCGSRREHPDNLTRSSKILKVGTSYIGGVGWRAYDNILQHYFRAMKRPPVLRDEVTIFDCFLKLWQKLRDKYQVVNDQPDDQDPGPFANIDSSFLVVNRRGIFEVSHDLSVVQFEQYAAIGSAEKYAFGALECLYETKRTARQIAVKAVGTAIHFDNHCGGEIECNDVKALRE